MFTPLSFRLSVMMFLQFFVWGAWYTTVGFFMAENGMEALTHWPYTVNPVAAIVAPFFLGLVADRFFATEKVLGVLHLVGGVVMLAVPQLAAAPTLFILALLLYNLCYMPTLGLTNSLAFHNIQDQEKQFPMIRVFGTVGWIVAGLFISFVLSGFVAGQAEATPLPLYTTAVGSIVLGLYCFTLPHTPPPAAGEKVSLGSIVGVDALRQLGSRSFYVFLLCSMLICIPLAAYYNYTQIFLGAIGVERIAATQTWGQISEVGFMLLIPLLFVRLGVKWMLGAGMAAWVLRYVLFALGAPDAVFWLVWVGIVLHGICYDFFFVTGQIYVDKKSTPAVRGQAQGLLVFATYGVGLGLGALVMGELVYKPFLGGAEALTLGQWQQFWFVPAAFAAVVLLLFVVTFHDRVRRREPAPTDAAPTPGVPVEGGA